MNWKILIWGYHNVAGRYYCKFLFESWIKGLKSRRRWQGGRWSFCYCSRILSIEGKLDLREELKKKQHENSWPEGRKGGRKERVFKFSRIDAIAVVIAIEDIVDARVKVLEKNFWFRLSEKTREVSTWNLIDEVAGEEFSLHLCDLRACGHEEGRINLGELLRKSSALFASNPNPNLVWEPRLSSQSTRVFGAFCLPFTIFLWSSHAHVSIEHFLAGHRSNRPSSSFQNISGATWHTSNSSFCTAAAYGWEFKSIEWSWPQFSAERRVCDCNSCVTLCWNLFCSDDSHLNLNLFQFALEWSASYVALQQHCCKRGIAFYFLPVFVV